MMNLMSASSDSSLALRRPVEPLVPIAHNSSEAFSSAFLMAVRLNPEPWVRDVQSVLESLCELEENWDSYGACPADSKSIEQAKAFIDGIGRVVSVGRPAVSLSPAGNAAFSWETSNGRRNLDVEVLKTGKIRFAFIDDDDESADSEGSTFDMTEIAGILTQW